MDSSDTGNVKKYKDRVIKYRKTTDFCYDFFRIFDNLKQTNGSNDGWVSFIKKFLSKEIQKERKQFRILEFDDYLEKINDNIKQTAGWRDKLTMKALEFLKMFHYMVFTNNLYQSFFRNIKENLGEESNHLINQDLKFKSVGLKSETIGYSIKINKSINSLKYEKDFTIENKYFNKTNNDLRNLKKIIISVRDQTIHFVLDYIGKFFNFHEQKIQKMFLKDTNGDDHIMFEKYLKNTQLPKDKIRFQKILEDLILLENYKDEKGVYNYNQKAPKLKGEHQITNNDKINGMRVTSKKSSQKTTSSLRISSLQSENQDKHHQQILHGQRKVEDSKRNFKREANQLGRIRSMQGQTRKQEHIRQSHGNFHNVRDYNSTDQLVIPEYRTKNNRQEYDRFSTKGKQLKQIPEQIHQEERKSVNKKKKKKHKDRHKSKKKNKKDRKRPKKDRRKE